MRRRRRLAQHIGAWDAGFGERFLAVGRRRSAHVAFHVRQPRAAAAPRDVHASGAHRQVAHSNRANFLELRRVLPDVDELLLADIAARQRELHAREYVAVRRYVAGAMARASWPGVEIVISDRSTRCAT